MAGFKGPGVILAGGAGRRIGGNKAEVLLAGRPLWRHVADRVQPQVQDLVVNALAPLGPLGAIPDTIPDLGPLGGILTALDWAIAQGAERVLTVAVDTPFLPRDLVAGLAEVEGDIAMAETADGAHGTTALWDVRLAGDLRAALAAGTRKVTAWTADRAALVRFEGTDPPPFFNVNTQADLSKAERWLA
ncbi:NTP transferase domain-containing protein [Gymnodinialimonas sp. 2305UL16-5]|uniref:NTP transferase domain-containing protein n=1 Tax=Gymnodinialimonas mytili TaxID=3126503 RepID=UPI00309F364E